MMEFTKLIGLPTFDLIRMRFSRLVENYILKRALEFNVLAPNKPADQETEERREKSIEGAFVLEPAPGLYQNIIVFDFRSLYPTIITAHNIGPEGFRCSCCREKEHVPEKEEYWFCQREKKFLPSVLEELILRRADLKRLIKEEKAKGNDTKILEARSYALKILANSFYGYLGFYGARWYSLESAAATTAYARNYIKQTIRKAEEKGFKVCYSDTDSCFVLLGTKILDQALEFMNEINFDLPGHMELEFQGFYPQGLFVAQKGTERGAKKRYALIDKEGKVKITGFETVRRNWSKIGKEVQEKVLSLVLTNQVEAAVQYVKETVKRLKRGEISNQQLIIKTQITRELDNYASVGPHVTIARRRQGLGEQVPPGTIVEYIIGKGFGLVRERAKLPSEVKEGEYDADYYINNQLLPAVASIFTVLGYSEEDLFKESSQTGLGKYF
jgi:DNA polymerase I